MIPHMLIMGQKRLLCLNLATKANSGTMTRTEQYIPFGTLTTSPPNPRQVFTVEKIVSFNSADSASTNENHAIYAFEVDKIWIV